MEMHAFGRLISVDAARRRLLASARPVERTERIRVDAGFGRVAAATYRAPVRCRAFPERRGTDTRSAPRTPGAQVVDGRSS